jgi:hypothetical protein
LVSFMECKKKNKIGYKSRTLGEIENKFKQFNAVAFKASIDCRKKQSWKWGEGVLWFERERRERSTVLEGAHSSFFLSVLVERIHNSSLVILWVRVCVITHHNDTLTFFLWLILPICQLLKDWLFVRIRALKCNVWS